MVLMVGARSDADGSRDGNVLLKHAHLNVRIRLQQIPQRK